MVRHLIIGVILVTASGCIDSRTWDAWKCEKLGVTPKTERFDDCVARLQRERDEWMDRRIRANEMTPEA